MIGLLDTLRSAPYKPRPLSLCLLGFLLLGGSAAAETVLGVQLPDGAKKVGENRYRAADDYEGTLKYYRSVYPPARYAWKPVVNQPGVKAIHIALPGKQAEGLNVYEANEEVRLYVVPGEVRPVKSKAKPAAGKKTARPKKR